MVLCSLFWVYSYIHKQATTKGKKMNTTESLKELTSEAIINRLIALGIEAGMAQDRILSVVLDLGRMGKLNPR